MNSERTLLNFCNNSRVADLGSGIRCLFDPWIRDPGSEMNNPDHISESLETLFLGLKYFNSLMRIWDPGRKNSDPGSGMEKIRVRDKHPGSATLNNSVKSKCFYI
jgi:hypothetical protein